MKTRVITCILLWSGLCCTVQPVWSQHTPVSDPKSIDTTEEVVFQQGFKQFMEKARSQSFNRREKQKMAAEYSNLIDQMDALYHGTPRTKTTSPKYSVGGHAVAHAVVKVCKRDHDQ